MSEVFAGIEAALSFGSLIANVTGVSLGILFGAMPGLTAAMGVALLIPLSFGMPPVEAFSMLLGMYAGAIYGGSITAILVGTPGAVPLPRRLQHLFHQPHILRHIGRQRLRRPQNHLGRIQGMQARGGLIHPHFFQEEPS